MNQMAGLRVLTMNVLSPENPDWARRRPGLAAVVGALQPDVLALQEVRVADAAELIAEMVGDGVWASDHYGVVADLVQPGHPPGTWSPGYARWIPADDGPDPPRK